MDTFQIFRNGETEDEYNYIVNVLKSHTHIIVVNNSTMALTTDKVNPKYFLYEILNHKKPMYPNEISACVINKFKKEPWFNLYSMIYDVDSVLQIPNHTYTGMDYMFRDIALNSDYMKMNDFMVYLRRKHFCLTNV